MVSSAPATASVEGTPKAHGTSHKLRLTNVWKAFSISGLQMACDALKFREHIDPQLAKSNNYINVIDETTNLGPGLDLMFRYILSNINEVMLVMALIPDRFLSVADGAAR
jgi:hypothetical protein